MILKNILDEFGENYLEGINFHHFYSNLKLAFSLIEEKMTHLSVLKINKMLLRLK